MCSLCSGRRRHAAGFQSLKWTSLGYGPSVMMTGNSPSSPGRNTLARMVPPSRSGIATSFSTSTGWDTTGLPAGFANPSDSLRSHREGLTVPDTVVSPFEESPAGAHGSFSVPDSTPARSRGRDEVQPGEPMTGAGELVGEECRDG